MYIKDSQGLQNWCSLLASALKAWWSLLDDRLLSFAMISLENPTRENFLVQSLHPHDGIRKWKLSVQPCWLKITTGVMHWEFILRTLSILFTWCNVTSVKCKSSRLDKIEKNVFAQLEAMRRQIDVLSKYRFVWVLLAASFFLKLVNCFLFPRSSMQRCEMLWQIWN